MCDWTITPRNPQASKDPVFDPNFEAHMRGREGGSQHSGLHTLNGVELYNIEDDHKVPDGACGSVFSAKVRLGTKDQFGKVTYDEYKLSSFFPDTLCMEHLKKAVIAAFKNYHGLKTSSVAGHQENFKEYTKKIKDTNVKWAGKVKITGKAGSCDIWIGSLQTGEGASKIYNAFPAINGKFI